MWLLLRVLLLSVTTAAICLIPLRAAQASLLVASYKDGLQATQAQFLSSSYDLIQSNIYQRQDYEYVAAEIVMRIGPQNPPAHGERWGVRLFEVTTNQLLEELFWVYDGFSGCVYNFYGNAVSCGIKDDPFYVQRFVTYWPVQCTPRVNSTTGQDYEYKTVGFHDAVDLATYTYKPTEYVPMVYATDYSKGILVPTLPGKSAEKTDVRVVVSDNLGCLAAVRDVKTTLTNTVAPQTGGHTHFTNPNEPGTGTYTAQTPWNGTVKTLNVAGKTVTPVIENGLTDMNGLFQAGYAAGDLSVEETITIKTMNRENKSGAVAQAEQNLIIRLPGLAPLPLQGPGYQINGTTNHGFNNNYMQPDMGRRLIRALPVTFANFVTKTAGGRPVTIPDLVYTAMNLPGGGLYDIGPSSDCKTRARQPCEFRKPPHATHRNGRNADLRIKNIPRQLRADLIEAIARSGLTTPYKPESPDNLNATHWHLER